jgi:pimeloyl-ACP methyl ester carboxylesterase
LYLLLPAQFYCCPNLQVYAIDLIGFGASDKPVQQYTIELWAELINDFVAEFAAGIPAVVVGNSIGSLSVLKAAAAAAEGQLAGVVLLNSAGAMNNKVGGCHILFCRELVGVCPCMECIDCACCI